MFNFRRNTPSGGQLWTILGSKDPRLSNGNATGDWAYAQRTMEKLDDPNKKGETKMKWKHPSNDIRREWFEKEAKLPPNQMAKQKKLHYERLKEEAAMISDDAHRAAQFAAITDHELKNLDEHIDSNIQHEGLLEFRDFVAGRGKATDYAKLGWWPTDGHRRPDQKKTPDFVLRNQPLSTDPSVYDYLDGFVDAKMDYKADLAKLVMLAKERGPSGLSVDQLWLLYKYVVLGMDPDEIIEEEYANKYFKNKEDLIDARKAKNMNLSVPHAFAEDRDLDGDAAANDYITNGNEQFRQHVAQLNETLENFNRGLALLTNSTKSSGLIPPTGGNQFIRGMPTGGGAKGRGLTGAVRDGADENPQQSAAQGDGPDSAFTGYADIDLDTLIGGVNDDADDNASDDGDLPRGITGLFNEDPNLPKPSIPSETGLDEIGHGFRDAGIAAVSIVDPLAGAGALEEGEKTTPAQSAQQQKQQEEVQDQEIAQNDQVVAERTLEKAEEQAEDDGDSEETSDVEPEDQNVDDTQHQPKDDERMKNIIRTRAKTLELEAKRQREKEEEDERERQIQEEAAKRQEERIQADELRQQKIRQDEEDRKRAEEDRITKEKEKIKRELEEKEEQERRRKGTSTTGPVIHSVLEPHRLEETEYNNIKNVLQDVWKSNYEATKRSQRSDYDNMTLELLNDAVKDTVQLIRKYELSFLSKNKGYRKSVASMLAQYDIIRERINKLKNSSKSLNQIRARSGAPPKI